MIPNKKIKRATLHKTCLMCGVDFQTHKKAKIYCDDPNCLELRKDLRTQILKEKKENTDNLVIGKGKFNNRTILQIQCSAEGPNGRCQEKYNVMYENVRSVYPKYCSKHANAWQRSIFEGKKNAENQLAGA
jgi:hypothetical protein